ASRFPTGQGDTAGPHAGGTPALHLSYRPSAALRVDFEPLDLLLLGNDTDGELRRLFPVLDALLLDLLCREHVGRVPEELAVPEGEIPVGVALRVAVPLLLV